MRSLLKRFDIRVCIVYAIVATLWIIFSDTLMAVFPANTPYAAALINIAKGLGFVTITTLALFVVLSREQRKRAQVEHQLYATDQLYRRVVEDQFELISRYRPDFTLTFVNQSYSQLFGKQPEDMIGQNLLDLVFADDRQQTLAHLSSLNASRPVISTEGRLVLADGSVRWYQWTDRIILDDAGQVIEYQGVGHDITEQKTHAESVEDMRQFLRNTLDAFPANTAVLDRDGTIIDTNAAWNRFADDNGASTHFKGVNYLVVSDLVTLQDAELSTAGIRAVITGQQEAFYLEYPCHSPTEKRWFGMLVTPFDEPAPRRVVVAHINITDRKLAEEELEIYQEHLENLVAQRTNELTDAKLRVEAILNNSPDGVLVAYPDLRIQQSNPTFNTLLAVEPEAYFQKSLLDIISADDAARVTALTQTAIAKRASQQIETRIHRRDGTSFDAELSIGYVHEANNLVCTIRDISERKQAEQALKLKLDEEREFQRYLKALHDISIELTQIDDLDDFFKRAVELGLERLGFERLGLFLYDPVKNLIQRTYGTDTDGNIRLENDPPFTPAPDGRLLKTLASADHFYYEEPAVLLDGDTPVATGWIAMTSLRSGTQSLGLLSVDNLITRNPATKPLLDILSLYGLTLGTLLARKQTDRVLHQSEANLRSVMNSTSVGIFLVDRQGFVRLANQLAFEYGERMYRQSLELGKTNLFDLDLEDRAGVEYLFQQAFAGERMNVELSRMTDSGMIVLDLHYDPVITPDGEVIGVTISFIDITQRKQTEEALRQALERANELSELKSRFVSMASHEFRTPLTSILSSSEILAHYREKMDGEQIDAKLGLIARQVRHLTSIVDDVLNLGRIQSGRIEFHPVDVDLDQLCQEVIADFQNRPDIPHEIHYTHAQPTPILRLDRTLIRQVITNLLSNAVKYSPEGKHIWVTLDSASLCVRDEGIGIPTADINRLFEPFSRANNVGGISGTGLGLAISKEAVERHGGTITVDSQQNVGSTFCVRFLQP